MNDIEFSPDVVGPRVLAHLMRRVDGSPNVDAALRLGSGMAGIPMPRHDSARFLIRCDTLLRRDAARFVDEKAEGAADALFFRLEARVKRESLPGRRVAVAFATLRTVGIGEWSNTTHSDPETGVCLRLSASRPVSGATLYTLDWVYGVESFATPA